MTRARHRSIRAAFLSLAAGLALVTAGCNPAEDLMASAPEPEELEPFDPGKLQLFYTLTLVQTLDLLKYNRDTMIIDVRTPDEFAVSHIAGAYNYWARSDDFLAEIGELDRGPKILIYGGEDVSVADHAVITMGEMGFRNVYRLIGGIDAWTAGDNPVVRDIPAPPAPAAAEEATATMPTVVIPR